MKDKYKNLASILILSVVFLLASCSNDNSFASDDMDKDAKLNLSIKTSLGIDPLVKGGDGSFSSLTLYVFNEATGYCEYAELIPNFTPESLQEFTKSINVSIQTKVVYAIANYNGSNKSFTPAITTNLTMAQLEALTVLNTNFTDTNVLMIGKKRINITSQYVMTEILMERLVARLDIHMFKTSELQGRAVEVQSVELVNDVLNSRCSYQNNVMITPVVKTNTLHNITTNKILTVTPSDLSEILPANAHTSFYSYQNIAASVSAPDDNITPYLKITVKIDGHDHIYKGYITDVEQTESKYSLMQNTVYRVIAVINHIDNELTIKTTIHPWSETSSQIGHAVKDTDFSLNPFAENNLGAITGTVHYPHLLNETSHADYSFKLTAPAGAVWTATLTNGLDFSFSSVGSIPGKLAVSTGIARPGEYEIRVGATKPWGGSNRSTHMYITVNGVKLKINPIIIGITRKFPGSNDTDILITQTNYQ